MLKRTAAGALHYQSYSIISVFHFKTQKGFNDATQYAAVSL